MRVVCPSCGRSYVVGVGQETTPFACSCGDTIDPAGAAETPQVASETALGEGQSYGEAEQGAAVSGDVLDQGGTLQATPAERGQSGMPSPLLVGLLYVLSFCACIVGAIWAIVWASGQEPVRRRHGRNALIIFGVMLAVGLVVALLLVGGGTRVSSP